MKQMEERSSKERYAKGSQVQIVGGVYRRKSPVETVVRMTRCYVDVSVPCLKREVRVRKTSVVQFNGERGEEKLENIVKEEPLVGAALRAVCTLLVRCGVQEGNEELHKAVDMYLAIAWHQKVGLAENEGGG
jgi:hypothetical protein